MGKCGSEHKNMGVKRAKVIGAGMSRRQQSRVMDNVRIGEDHQWKQELVVEKKAESQMLKTLMVQGVVGDGDKEEVNG